MTLDRAPVSTQATRNRLNLRQICLVVLVVGLVVTGALTVSSRLSYLHNEQRLSNLQTSLTASALGIAPADLERRLGQAVGGCRPKRPIPPRLSAGSSRRRWCRRAIRDRTLALVNDGSVQVLAHVGAKPINSPTGKAASALFERAAKSDFARHDQSRGQRTATVRLSDVVRRTGWNLSSPPPDKPCQAVAGLPFPPSSPDAGLNIAIYFGKTTSSAALVETNVSHLPLTGTVSTAVVPFGSSVLTLVISPKSPLAGRWSEFLPWGILVVGLLFTFGLVVNDRAACPAASARRTTRRREPTFVRRAAKRVADPAAIAAAEGAPDDRRSGVRCPLHPRGVRNRGRWGLVQRDRD